MGFPDVILPGLCCFVIFLTLNRRKLGISEWVHFEIPDDVRNDLYLTLIQGEFKKGTKKADKNVEVTVEVCNQHGEVLQVENRTRPPIFSIYWEFIMILHSGCLERDQRRSGRRLCERASLGNLLPRRQAQVSRIPQGKDSLHTTTCISFVGSFWAFI